MSSNIDNAELMSLLESPDVKVFNEVKDLIHDQLKSGKDAWLVNTIVDSYVVSSSERCLELLSGLHEPHDKHLFDRMLDHWKSGNKVETLAIIGHLVRREPLWLHKLAGHQLTVLIFKSVKNESDTLTLMTTALTVTALLPVLPLFAIQFWSDITELFSRLVSVGHSKSVGVAESLTLHVRVTIHVMFNRLYGMYPCHFLTFLRGVYSRPEAVSLFKDIIKPMLAQVRLHPLLVTATKEREFVRERWKNKDVHDIMVECAQLALDLPDASHGPDNDQTLHERRRLTIVRKPSVESAANFNIDQLSNSVSWTPSSVCGLSTPPPTTPGLTAVGNAIHPLADVKPVSNALSSSGRESKPNPLVLTSGSVDNCSPLPLTPYIEPGTPKQKTPVFDFTKSPPVGAAEESSTLDLSGRFCDSGFSQQHQQHQHQQRGSTPGSCSVSTQTCDTHIDICHDGRLHAAERSTSTEEPVVSLDSDTTGSPLSGVELDHLTSSSVRAFMKKIKRIRFNSITVAKDHHVCNSVMTPRRISHSNSCPDLSYRDVPSDLDATVSSLSPQQHWAGCSLASPMKQLRSLTDVTSLAAIVERADASTQTSLYVTACESMNSEILRESYSVPYELLTAITVPSAPFLQCYSCLRKHADLKSDTVMKTWSVASVSVTHSASDLLDYFIKNCIAAHSALVEGKSGGGQLPAIGQHQQSSESHVAASEIAMLRSMLLFERRQREVYARRNARLMSRMAQLVSASEQNEAIRDQLRLQETDMIRLKDLLRKEQLATAELKQSNERQQKEIDELMRKYHSSSEDARVKSQQLEESLNASQLKISKLERELELANHSLLLKDEDMKLLEKKASGAVRLKEQITQLNTELLLMGELHKKYQQRLTETTNSQTSDFFNLRTSLQAATNENNDLKMQLRHVRAELNAAVAKLTDVEEKLQIKEILIHDQKQLLEQTKVSNNNDQKIMCEKMTKSLNLQKSLQLQVYELQSEIATLKCSQSPAKSSATGGGVVQSTAATGSSLGTSSIAGNN